ncbi:MAG: hypothetical protein ED556_08490 [Winogradskyella sp.]|uniref:hypothetical protein n=1 Tax=Winogradskyella sp. TaxID=1883156 RepID=UPI000F3FA764|nr:hypothetical protein [Winogradskyella sp.]RNC86322.1 MAG: hypothetical protein ED556_08490 [Winogradskyella sp.]
MKKYLLAICLIVFLSKTKAQEASVETSVYGLQIGILGFWAHNEARLSNAIALRSELGVELGYNDSVLASQSGFYGGISIIVEPRWYYNLNRRISKNKRIDGNTGNFISLRVNYHPDVLLFSEIDNLDLISDISIIPSYGLRRSLGQHFNYEFAFGIGYIEYLEEYNSIFEESDVGVNLHLRIGYRF